VSARTSITIQLKVVRRLLVPRLCLEIFLLMAAKEAAVAVFIMSLSLPVKTKCGRLLVLA